MSSTPLACKTRIFHESDGGWMYYFIILSTDFQQDLTLVCDEIIDEYRFNRENIPEISEELYISITDSSLSVVAELYTEGKSTKESFEYAISEIL